MTKELKRERVTITRHGTPPAPGSTLRELWQDRKDDAGRDMPPIFLGIEIELDERPGLHLYAQHAQLKPLENVA